MGLWNLDNFKHFKIFILKLSNAKSFKIVHPYDFKIVLPFYWSAFKIVILKSSSFPFWHIWVLLWIFNAKSLQKEVTQQKYDVQCIHNNPLNKINHDGSSLTPFDIAKIKLYLWDFETRLRRLTHLF